MKGFSQISKGKQRCVICGENGIISSKLQVCLNCVRENPEESRQLINSAHRNVRKPYGLPPKPPRSPGGLECNLCSNNCKIGSGEKGYCGLRINDGELSSLSSPNLGLLYYYLDPHVTNCCGAWFCPAGTGSGHPIMAKKQGPEYGYNNLSIFFYGCNFNCQFCQNSSHKNLERGNKVSTEELVSKVKRDKTITCICYFGGSPEPQLPFSLNLTNELTEIEEGRVLRFCWEWNGCGNPRLVKEAAEVATKSGGNIKFDLKSYDPDLSLALSGVDNSAAFSNFEMIGREFYNKRPEVPMLTATTLLVPGYVDAFEVRKIASFISDINESIPYSLLLFHPKYAMSDLPFTSYVQAKSCYAAATEFLENVHVGNLKILGIRNMREFINKP